MRYLILALCAPALLSCIPDADLEAQAIEIERARNVSTIQEGEEELEPVQEDVLEPVQQEHSDLEVREGETWRPRDFNFLAHCEDADVDSRLPPAVWFESYLETHEKVLGLADDISGSPTLESVSSHTDFWEQWCPPSHGSWEDAHVILLVGLYHMEDYYYFSERYEQTQDPEYQSRAEHSYYEGWRYIDEGIRDSIEWYGEMTVFDISDPRVEVCLAGGTPDHQYMPLCDDYIGPVIDPSSRHYNPNHPNVTEYLEQGG